MNDFDDIIYLSNNHISQKALPWVYSNLRHGNYVFKLKEYHKLMVKRLNWNIYGLEDYRSLYK